MPRTAMLAMFALFNAQAPAWADDLPTVYRGHTLPEAEFSAPSTIHVLSGGSVIEISGSFSTTLPRDFVTVLAQTPQVRTVWLESPGGRVQPAIAIAKIIQSRGLDTYVGRFCVSACTLAFLGGHQRFLAPNARLGFHQAHLPDTPPERWDPVLRQAYRAFGVPSDFIDHVLRTPPEALWFPTPSELSDASITTGPPPADLLTSDGTPSPDSDQTETVKDLRWASDDALIQFATAFRDLLDELQDASPELCWDYTHHVSVDLATHARHETLEALAAALRRARDDVREAPKVGFDAAEKSRALTALFGSLPEGQRAATLAALRVNGDHAAFCPAMRTVLGAGLALPMADRGPALRAMLSGG
jgi:hypothetical protein